MCDVFVLFMVCLEGMKEFIVYVFTLGSLAENNRLKLIPSVVRAFGKLMSATRGEVICTVTTAKVCFVNRLGNKSLK